MKGFEIDDESFSIREKIYLGIILTLFLVTTVWALITRHELASKILMTVVLVLVVSFVGLYRLHIWRCPNCGCTSLSTDVESYDYECTNCRYRFDRPVVDDSVGE